MKLELLIRAREYIEKLANGINPTTDENLENESVFNNPKVIRCLFFVEDILKEQINITKRNTKKIDFDIAKIKLNDYQLVDDVKTISEIVKSINALKNNEFMSNLKVKDLTSWLVSINLLEEKIINNKKYKLPTESAKELGFSIEERNGMYGNYYIVLYNKQAQEFIINNFECFQEYLNHLQK